MSKRWAVMIWLVLLLSSTWILTIRAADDGCLNLICETEKNGKKIYLSQDIYAVTLVAEAEIVNGGAVAYEMRPEFKNYEKNWGELTAAQLKDSAKELAAYAAAHNLYDRTAQTDSEGKASFSSLKNGLYLVMRIKADEKNTGYQAAPVLVSIPSCQEGKLLYEVFMDLKFEWDDKPDTSASVNAGSTGDNTKISEITGLLFVSMLSLALFAACKFRLKEKSI